MYIVHSFGTKPEENIWRLGLTGELVDVSEREDT